MPSMYSSGGDVDPAVQEDGLHEDACELVRASDGLEDVLDVCEAEHVASRMLLVEGAPVARGVGYVDNV